MIHRNHTTKIDLIMPTPTLSESILRICSQDFRLRELKFTNSCINTLIDYLVQDDADSENNNDQDNESDLFFARQNVDIHQIGPYDTREWFSQRKQKKNIIFLHFNLK